MSNIPYEVWEEGEMLKEIEQLREENEQLKTQISILTQANNEAYATISMIRGDKQ